MAILIDGDMLEAEQVETDDNPVEEPTIVNVEESSSFPVDLIEEAYMHVRNYFYSRGKYFLPSTSLSKEIIAASAPKLLTLQPTHFKNSEANCFISELSKGVSPDDVRGVLRDVGGVGIEQLDFYNDDKIADLDDLCNYISDIRQLRKTLLSHGWDKGFPFALGMSMKPGLRDLVFTAIGRRERDRRTDIFSVGYFNDSANKTPVQMLEHHCCPTLSEITSVASEYGVSNVKATLVELNKVMASYEEKWNGGVSQT